MDELNLYAESEVAPAVRLCLNVCIKLTVAHLTHLFHRVPRRRLYHSVLWGIRIMAPRLMVLQRLPMRLEMV